jgi:hypothetical protein
MCCIGLKEFPCISLKVHGTNYLELKIFNDISLHIACYFLCESLFKVCDELSLDFKLRYGPIHSKIKFLE